MKKGYFFSWPLILVLFFSFHYDGIAQDLEQDDVGLFSARISQLNPIASLIRIHVDFVNAKFLNVNEPLNFWTPQNKKRSCQGYILGKTNHYILIKVIEYSACEKGLRLSQGSYIKLYSKDLKSN